MDKPDVIVLMEDSIRLGIVKDYVRKHDFVDKDILCTMLGIGIEADAEDDF